MAIQRWTWGSLPAGTTWQDRVLAIFNAKLKGLENFLGALVGLVVGRKTADTNSATPSVSGSAGLLLRNTVATTITAFGNGEAGQHLVVLALDNQTTIQHGPLLRLNGNADWVVKNGETRAFWTPEGSVWYEVPRSISAADIDTLVTEALDDLLTEGSDTFEVEV